VFLGRFGVVDLSGFKTEILHFRRNPTFQRESYVSKGILRPGFRSYDQGLDPTPKA
jgi:hypothetical protein